MKSRNLVLVLSALSLTCISASAMAEEPSSESTESKESRYEEDARILLGGTVQGLNASSETSSGGQTTFKNSSASASGGLSMDAMGSKQTPNSYGDSKFSGHFALGGHFNIGAKAKGSVGYKTANDGCGLFIGANMNAGASVVAADQVGTTSQSSASGGVETGVHCVVPGNDQSYIQIGPIASLGYTNISLQDDKSSGALAMVGGRIKAVAPGLGGWFDKSYTRVEIEAATGEKASGKIHEDHKEKYLQGSVDLVQGNLYLGPWASVRQIKFSPAGADHSVTYSDVQAGLKAAVAF